MSDNIKIVHLGHLMRISYQTSKYLFVFVIYWAFHLILVTSFLVVFCDEVTKILRNSLFIFHFVLPILACKRKTLYRKSRNLSDEKPKTKLPKYVMSRTTVLRISHSLRIKRVHEFTPVWRKCAQIWLLKLWAANSLSTFKSKFILWLDLLRGQLDQKMGFSWNRKWQLEI